jgi:hypothetical protein
MLNCYARNRSVRDLRTSALWLELPSLHHPANCYSSRNACRKGCYDCFNRMPLHTPLCVVKQFRSRLATLSGGTPRRAYAILKGIRNSRRCSSSLVRCFIKLFAHLFQH